MQKVRRGPTKRIGQRAIASKPAQITSSDAPIVAALVAGAISLTETGVIL